MSRSSAAVWHRRRNPPLQHVICEPTGPRDWNEGGLDNLTLPMPCMRQDCRGPHLAVDWCVGGLRSVLGAGLRSVLGALS